MTLSPLDARRTATCARYAGCLMVSLTTGTAVSFGMPANAHGADPNNLPYFRPKPIERAAPKPNFTGFSMAETDRGKSVGKTTDYYVTAPSVSLAPVSPDPFDHIGPFLLEKSDTSPIPMETGRTITAAYPVKGVPGLDLTINMFAGHRQTNTGSNVGTGALTAGIRYKW